MRKIIHIGILVMMSLYALAQNQVRVTVNIIPPYSTNLADYYSAARGTNKMIVTVQNMTATEQVIYGRVDIQGTGGQAQGVRIYTDPNKIPNHSITLAPREVRQLFADEIRSIYQVSDLVFENTSQQQIESMNRVPEGEYSFCLTIYDKRPGRENIALSAAKPAGCTTIFMRNVEAPMLIRPQVNAEVKSNDPQNVIFSWNQPVGTPPGTLYRLKVVEILESPGQNLDPNVVYEASRSPVFDQEVMGNVFLFGPGEHALVKGRRYAWAVTAVDPAGETSYQNNGRSEVRAFTYGGTDTGSAPWMITRTQEKSTVGRLANITFSPDLTIRNLHRNEFKGKLTWAYRKSEAGNVTEPSSATGTGSSGSAIQKMPGNLGGKEYMVAQLETSPANLHKSGSKSTNTNIQTNTPAQNQVAAVQVPYTPNTFFSTSTATMAVSTANIPQVTVKESLAISKYRRHEQRIQALADDIKRPLAQTTVSVYLRKDPNKINIFEVDKSSTPFEILAGRTTTNADGEFSLVYNDQIPDDYDAYLKIEDSNFEFATYEIPVAKKQNGTYDFGELLGLAKTYRVKLKIVNEEDMELDSATFKIVRRMGFYRTNPNLATEVWRDQSLKEEEEGTKKGSNRKTQSGSFFEGETVAEGRTGAYLPRFFFSRGLGDSYSVIVEAGHGIEKTVKTLTLAEPRTPEQNYSDQNSVSVLEYKVVANIPLPVVTGRVLIEAGDIPVQGASITVRKVGSRSGDTFTNANGWTGVYLDFNARSGTSDSLGNFRIENIPVSPEHYQIVVRYKGKETIYKQKTLYLSQRGIVEHIDPLHINAELITVTGKVVDTGGEPLPNATLTWKNGGNAFYSDDEGNFTGSQVEGTHILVARKPGFKDTEYKVDLKIENRQSSQTPPRGQSAGNAQIASWASNIASLQQNFTGVGTYNGKIVTPKVSATTAIAGKVKATFEQQQRDYYAVFGDAVPSGSTSSGHVIVLGNFYVKAIVKDQNTGQPIANAGVSAENDPEITRTDTQGIAIVNNVPGGNAAIVVNGPEDSFYAGVKAEVIIDPSKDTVTVEINLKTGSRAQGRVISKGAPVAQAEVAIEGLEHIKTETDNNGNYTLIGVPVGEYTLIAAKEGLLADKKTGDFTANETRNLDFNLTDPGFNASRLLGFKLILHKSAPGPGANEFVISGELVELPDNPLFKIAENRNFRIKFTDKTIIKDGNIIYPKGNELVTDVSQIKLRAFDYLAITLKNTGGIRIRPLAGNKAEGEIFGTAEIDIGGTFSVLSGIKLPGSPLGLKSGTNTVIAPIRSSGNVGADSFGITGSTDGWSLYGVKITPDLAASNVNKDGFNFKGKVQIEGVPLLSNQDLQLQKLTISKRGEITAAEINLNPAPTLSLASWKLKLTGVKINQYGLKLSGDLDIPVPASANAKIGVRELGINGGNLSGGTFLLPQAGIDIFGVVKFTTAPGKDFTFQKMAGTNHYRFIGAGTIRLPEWINEKVELDNFSIATNGHFSVIAKLDVELNFANMAKLGITRFGFASNTKTITVGGKFRLNIPLFGAGADGTLHFQYGRAPRMDELGINFNLGAAIALEAALTFRQTNEKTEFRGKGGLKLVGITGIGLEFWYEKPRSSGPRVGAQFTAGVIIPIGVVNLVDLTGGFDFNFSQNIYSINVGGKITLAPDPAGVIALDPLSLKVTSTPQGPVFEGNAGVKVMTVWSLAKATMKLDFARKHFFIDGEFGAGFSAMKGLSVESKSGVRLELFTGGDNYWLVSGYSRTRIFNIFNTGVTIAAGWNVPRTAHESLRDIPNYVLTNGRLYGGYFGTYSDIDIGSPSISVLKIVTISAWYKNTSAVEVYANFKSNSFGFKLASSWRAGAKIEVAKIGEIAGADIRFSGALEAYYSDNNNAPYWGMNGRVSGSVRGSIGCGDSCGINWALFVPCGATLCLSGHARMGYDSRSGFDVSLHLGQ